MQENEDLIGNTCVEEESKKRPLALEWDKIMGQKDDDEPPAIVIVKEAAEPPPPQPWSPVDHFPKEEFVSLDDHQLEETIRRQKANLGKLSRNLPDNGEKLRANIKALEEERERRKPCRPQTDVDECAEPIQSTDVSPRDCSSSVQSQFASIFSRKMEENIDDGAKKAFGKELSTLNHCNRQKTRSNGVLSPKGRHKSRSSSKQWPFRYASNPYQSGDRRATPKSDQKGKFHSIRSFYNNGESLATGSTKKKDDHWLHSSIASRPKKEQRVVLLDEDETQPNEKIESVDKLAECLKDAKIYYPSRDDPESVEICYTDISCLQPKEFLTSPIMNFYIRYLQLKASPTNRAITDYHFFNTFFYKKLKQAVSYKGSDKESSFVTFRRWWRGVNIFQKAYVFIPIHDDLHWSLVIICIPNKEDESGPIILHLDSLGLHHSKLVFEDIRSYLSEEWNYMNQEASPSDLPILDKIWKHLPYRIDENIISVIAYVKCQDNYVHCG
uniref:Ubiquitin-like-specific protease 1D isoform X1 n=2 Tax=Rhizophora mucronata TaxID=61149 RepID=A0A2P2M8R0_RHIMU